MMGKQSSLHSSKANSSKRGDEIKKSSLKTRYHGSPRAVTLVITALAAVLFCQFIVTSNLVKIFAKFGVYSWEEEDFNAVKAIEYWHGHGNTFMLFIIAILVTSTDVFTTKFHATCLAVCGILSPLLMFGFQNTFLVNMGILLGTISLGFCVTATYAILELFYDYGLIVNAIIAGAGDASYGLSLLILQLMNMSEGKGSATVYTYTAMCLVTGILIVLVTPTRWTQYSSARQVLKGDISMKEYKEKVNPAKGAAISSYNPSRDPPYFGLTFMKQMMTPHAMAFVTFWTCHFIRIVYTKEKFFSILTEVPNHQPHITPEDIPRLERLFLLGPLIGVLYNLAFGFFCQATSLNIGLLFINIGGLLMEVCLLYGSILSIQLSGALFGVCLAINFCLVSLWYTAVFGYDHIRKFQGATFVISGLLRLALSVTGAMDKMKTTFFHDSEYQFIWFNVYLSLFAFVPLVYLLLVPPPKLNMTTKTQNAAVPFAGEGYGTLEKVAV